MPWAVDVPPIEMPGDPPEGCEPCMVTYLQAQPDGTYRAETRKVWCYVQWPEEQALTHELRAAQAHIYPPDC